jgi:hypothetical protein
MAFLVPIFTAISGTLAAGGLGATLLRIGGSIALSALTKKKIRKQDAAKNPASVTVTEPVSVREMVYGRSRKGGTVIFFHTTGAPDPEYLHLVIAVAPHWIKSIGAVYFDGELAVDAAGVAQGRWAGLVTIDKRLGTTTQTAFAGLMAEVPDLWTAKHRALGCALLYLKLKYSADAFPTGQPNVSMDIEGKADILDPRTGLRGYSENPALCLADYMCHPSYGLAMQISASDGIDPDDLIEAANICDETITLSDVLPHTFIGSIIAMLGGTEPRYSLNGIVDLSDAPKANIEAMLTAMAGRCAWSAGVWRIRAGAYRAPTVAFDEDDLRNAGARLVTRRSRSESFNAVRGTFVSPTNDWQPDDFPAVLSDVYLAEDNGNRVYKDIDLPFTKSATMAQRLAKIELERSRRQMNVQFSGKLSAWRAGILDTVTLDYGRWGFAAKPFEVLNVNLQIREGALLPDLKLAETSPLVYVWSATEEQIYQAAPRTNLPSRFDISPPGSPEISEELYVTRDGSGVKAMATVSWRASDSSYVAQYQLEARQAGGVWQNQGRTDVTKAELRDIAPGIWEFRVKAISNLGVSSDWASSTKEIHALTAPPAALVGVTLQQVGGFSILKWQRVPDLDVRIGGSIVIRHSASVGASWVNSASLDQVQGGNELAVVPLLPGSYLLRARDSSGVMGPVTVMASDGAQVLAFGPVMSLIAEPNFVGTHVGTFADGGALRLAGETLIDAFGLIDDIDTWDWEGGANDSGTFTFSGGMDFGLVKRVRLRRAIELAAYGVLDLIDTRTNQIDVWPDFDGGDASDIDAIVEVRTTADNPSSAPVWSTWGRLDSAEFSARGVQARVQLISRDPVWVPMVTTLQLIAEEIV